MRADFAVILDSNVLAESAVSDLLLRLAEEPRLLLPRWTGAIWAETRRTLVVRLRWPEQIADSRIGQAKEHFPEAMVDGYEAFTDRCGNDPGDRHVLAAAIRARVETIVTMNLRHFEPEHLEPWGIAAEHPDAYLKVLYDHDEGAVVHVLHEMAARRSYDLAAMLSRLSAHVPGFSRHVAADLDLVVPAYVPRHRKADPA